MAFANVTVTSTEPNITVSANATNVSVAQTTSNITVSSSATLSNADIRAALGNTFPILYDTSTGVISIDGSAISGGNVVNSGNLSGNITIDKQDGAFFEITPTANITGITLNNFNAGETLTLVFEQNAIGGAQIDTTTHASNWTAWNFAAGSTTIDTNPNNWSVMSIFGLGTTGSAASEYYASIVREEANDTITNLTVTNNVSAGGNVSGTNFIGNVVGTVSSLSNHDTDDLSEGSSNQYFTQSRARTSINVSTNSASGGGALSYNSGSGTLIYTPPDLSSFGLTNAQAQAFIESSGLTMTANVTSNSLISTTNNISGQNITASGIFTGGSAVTDTHNLTGNLNVTGNVEVSGNLNYRNVTDLQVQNTELIMNANAATDSTVSFIVNRPVGGANTVLRWNESDDKWQFSNDGSTYQNLIGLTDFSITTASASGSGALSYSNTTGVFTFTPADLSAGVSNAQAQAFIEANGLDMTANITSNALISTSANIDSTASINFTADTSDFAIIKVEADTPSDSTSILDVTSARSADGGPQNIYRKATGTIASPGAIGTRDYVYRNRFFGHDGTDYQETFGAMVYQDSDVGGVSANIVPLAYEFYTHQGGNVNAGFIQSLIRMDSDRNIIFNDDGTRTFGSGQGNANITMDGTINTVSGINATGNISGGNVIATTGLHGAKITIPDASAGQSSIANIEFGIGGANTITIANNGSLVFSDNNGVLTGVNLFNASNQINCLHGNINASTNSSAGGFSGGIGLTKPTDGTIYSGYSLAIGTDRPQGTIAITRDGAGSSVNDQSWHKYEFFGSDTGSSRDEGIRLDYYRSLGQESGPTVVGDNDIIQENRYHGYDGTQFYNGAKDYVYHDTLGGAASSNTMNLTREFTTEPSLGNETSRLRLCANGTIQFNTNGVLQDGTNGGNASIALDGTISSVANITATGNVQGAYVLGNGSALSSLTSSQITDFSSASNSAITTKLGDLTSNVDTTASLNFTADTSDLALITAVADTGSSGTTVLDITSARSGDGGPQTFYSKATGSIASPGAISTRDYVYRERYKGHDGTDYQETMGYMVYQDSDVGGVSSNIVPLAFEFYTNNEGNVNAGFIQSLIRMDSNRTIMFNDDGTRTFGSGTGNANITQDGTINTVADINATGNIVSSANINAAGGTLTGIVTSNSNITTTANVSGNYILGNGSQLTGISGTYSNSDVETFLSANVVTANIDTQGNINVNQDIHLANAVFTDKIFPFTSGGTFSLTSLRATDVGIGSPTFFFPDTGANQTGAVLTTQANGVGTFNIGLSTESESSVEMIESKIYRDGTNGTAMDFYKAGGNIASPTAPGANDYVVQMDCFIHDGTQFLNAAGYHVFQDGDSGSVGTNDTPVSHEFYVKKDQTGFQKSVMKLTADQTIIFNDTGVRNFGNYKGTANISADGSFHTAGDVTIDGRLKLPNYTTTEVNALSSPAAGDTVFNTTENTICFYNGSAWHKVTSTAL